MVEPNGYVHKELKVKFKTLCAAHERSMSDVLVELITDWHQQEDEPNAGSNSNR